METNLTVTKCNPIQNWLDTVAFSHSNSKHTAKSYTLSFQRFLAFSDKTAEQILAEYEIYDDRTFKRKYANLVRAWISSLTHKGYATKSISNYLAAVKSFFKYNDLPLGYVPVAKNRVTFHNRDITKEEIADILTIARPRDRAFFAIMAQSGLRPHTICNLQLEQLQPDFSEGRIPCKVDVPRDKTKGQYKAYFTFIGEEAVKHLKDYLKTKTNLTSESYVFTNYGTKEPLSRPSISNKFRDAVLRLKAKGELDFKQKGRGKPSELRLYSLRKFFRKYAHQAGFEIVQFWMGHVVKAGVDESYRPRDPEFHRQLYTEKAMPFLRIEEATPRQTEKAIEKLEKQNQTLTAKVEKLNKELEKLQWAFRKYIQQVEWEKEERARVEMDQQLSEIVEEVQENPEAYDEQNSDEDKKSQTDE